MDSIVARCSRIGRHGSLTILLLAALGTGAVALPASADDLDVYRARIEAQQKPNILLVLDYSGSMGRDVDNNEPPADGKDSRLEILKQAVSKILEANEDDINAGIGSMYSTLPSGVRWPVSDLTADANELDPAIAPGITNRDVIVSQLERIPAGGWTATVNALAEAALYFQGGRVANGDVSPLWSDQNKPDVWDSATQSYGGGSEIAAIPSSYTPSDAFAQNQPLGEQYGFCYDYTPNGGTVNNCAPFEPTRINECEMIDGENYPEDGTGLKFNRIRRCEYQSSDLWQGANYISPITGQCAVNAIVLVSDGEPTQLNDTEALTEVLGGPISDCEDISDTVFANTSGDGTFGNCGKEIASLLNTTPQIPGNPDSTVRTYTIGFNTTGDASVFLEEIAKAGGGMSETADDIDELIATFANFFDSIKEGGETFTELAIDVDRANFSNADRAYFNLFRPDRGAAWRGNTKGYYMTAEGLKDLHGDDVANDDGSAFADNIQSFWSSTPDGDKVNEGGVSEQLVAPATARKLYTSLNYAGGSVELSDSANLLSSANNTITQGHLGLSNAAAERTAVLDWIQTAPMGDALHTLPVTVDYGNRRVLYSMTNQGLLHAIDASDPGALGASLDTSGGEEIFGFMPERLLANLPALMNNATSFDHIYGLDGGITRVHTDIDGDGVVDTGDQLLLIIGMRRGGDSYYALDVTDPDSPSLEWNIDSNTPGFGSLGETWSKMALIEARSGTGKEPFLVFSGGYDAATLDGTGAPTPATKGNALYVIDTAGKLVWSVDGTSKGEMTYAITADPTVVDSDADGYADRLYVGDLGGQVWRVDFDDMRSTTDYSVTRVADLASGTHQPFFYSPSVSLDQYNGETRMLVALGSGDRTDPMNDTSENKFWVLEDYDIARGAPASIETITQADLYDATDNLIASTDATVANTAAQSLNAARGWFISLDQGEKSLARMLTFEGLLLATTFEPVKATGEDVCGVDPIGRYYQLDIRTGEPSNSFSTINDSDNYTRYQTVPTTGIPSSPVVVFPDNSESTKVYVGLNEVEQVETQLSRVYWHAR